MGVLHRSGTWGLACQSLRAPSPRVGGGSHRNTTGEPGAWACRGHTARHGGTPQGQIGGPAAARVPQATPEAAQHPSRDARGDPAREADPPRAPAQNGPEGLRDPRRQAEGGEPVTGRALSRAPLLPPRTASCPHPRRSLCHSFALLASRTSCGRPYPMGSSLHPSAQPLASEFTVARCLLRTEPHSTARSRAGRGDRPLAQNREGGMTGMSLGPRGSPRACPRGLLSLCRLNACPTHCAVPAGACILQS